MKELHKVLLLIALLLSASYTYADHDQKLDSINGVPEAWFHKDFEADAVRGVSSEKVYNEVVSGKKSKTVIVAVIDSGVDIEHEDLNSVIWTNEDEIPNNGIDDDNNGYVDDVHGWNFIGGADGSHVDKDTYELTRLYVVYKARFQGKDKASIAKADMADYKRYLQVKADYIALKTEKVEEYNGVKGIIQAYESADEAVTKHLGTDAYTLDDVKAISTTDKELTAAVNLLWGMMENGVSRERIADAKDHYTGLIDYSLNEEFDPRSIVGDNYNDVTEKYYGNNDVKGPDASHGTHVSGIIAAARNNGIGIDGIADNVKIMVLRVVPNGDERDKDIANAVRYAADNGAQIINMSFGKKYSPRKDVVDQAFQYAEQKGLLMLHAAGNDAENNDKVDHYPTKYLADKGGEIKTWIEVGASSWKRTPDFVGGFSNYGKKTVDIFAPGVDVYSTTPENNYEAYSGTSMATPVVVGVAALLWSYYPELTALDVKKILLSSATPYGAEKIVMPSEDDKVKIVKFGKLSTTGGIVNVYRAFKAAENYKSGTIK